MRKVQEETVMGELTETGIVRTYEGMPNSVVARRGGPGPYIRTDFIDQALQLRVEELAKRCGVKPGVVMERLAADHLSELEAEPQRLTEGALLAEEAALMSQLEALRKRMGRK